MCAPACVCVCVAEADQDKKEPCVKNVSSFKWGLQGWGGRGKEEKKKGCKGETMIKEVFLVRRSGWG